MQKYILSLLALLPLGAAGQDLHKDITVEQQTSPVTREAVRLSILPEVKLPALRQTPLSYSSRVVSAPVPNVITTLEPAAWSDPETDSSQRGYAVLGIFPLLNADLSAGYRIVDSDRTRLSIWGQYDGSVYHRQGVIWRDHTASAGLDLHQDIGSRATLYAGLDYTYGYHNQWEYSHLDGARFGQSTSRFNFDAAFKSTAGGLGYSVYAKVQHFGFYNTPAGPGTLASGDDGEHLFTTSAVRQNLIDFGGIGSLATGATSRFELSARVDVVNTSTPYNGAAVPFGPSDAYRLPARTSGVVRINPRFVNTNDKTSVTVGATMDVAINSGKALSFAPDVTLAWTPAQIFGIEATAKGGTVLNTLASLHDGVTPYLNPTMAYRSSRIPYDFGGRITFGPLLNTTIEAFGGYAKASDWLMPVGDGSIYPGGAVFETLDLSGYHFGVSLGYDNGKTVAAKVKWTTAPSKQFDGYYQWRDRARHVIEADVRVRPMKPLTITGGFEFRSGRATYIYGPELDVVNGIHIYPAERVSLGSQANLTLGASWAFTRRLSVFVSGENLLCRTWQKIGYCPVQGITGLVGASYKF